MFDYKQKPLSKEGKENFDKIFGKKKKESKKENKNTEKKDDKK